MKTAELFARNVLLICAGNCSPTGGKEEIKGPNGIFFAFSFEWNNGGKTKEIHVRKNLPLKPWSALDMENNTQKGRSSLHRRFWVLDDKKNTSNIGSAFFVANGALTYFPSTAYYEDCSKGAEFNLFVFFSYNLFSLV